MKTKSLLALLLSFCIFLPVLAQTKPAAPAQPQKPDDEQDDIVRITTNLVQVDAVVTKDGKLVTDLTADDFEIYEDGKRQTITSFAYISNVPAPTSQITTPAVKGKSRDVIPVTPLKRDDPRRTIAIVVDDLGISAESMGHIKHQVRKFVNEQMQPNDLVAIIRTGGELGVLQQFTNDKRVLNRAVDKLRWNFCSRVGLYLFAPEGIPTWERCRGAFGNTMRSLHFILDAMGHLSGRKSMVVMSDSLPRESQDEFYFGPDHRYFQYASTSSLIHKVAEKAIRSSVVIYTVDTQGLAVGGITAADSFSSNDIRNLEGMRDRQQRMRDLLDFRAKMLLSRREGGELIARQTGGFSCVIQTTSNCDGSWKIRAVTTSLVIGRQKKRSTGAFTTSRRR